MQFYLQLAYERKIFPSFWQRPMLVEEGLRSKPVWTIEETGMQNELREIQSYWKIILGEALTVLDFRTGGFTKYFEDINDSGKWDHFVLFANGNKEEKNCKKMPVTCSLMVSDITSNDFGQVTLRFFISQFY